MSSNDIYNLIDIFYRDLQKLAITFCYRTLNANTNVEIPNSQNDV